MLDRAYHAATEYYYLGEQREGSPTANALWQAKKDTHPPKNPLREQFLNYYDKYSKIKAKFENLWNSVFAELYHSQRSDGKGRNTTRKEWREEWHKTLTDKHARPRYYFVGYIEKDQKQWQMSTIWSSESRMKAATGYPPE